VKRVEVSDGRIRISGEMTVYTAAELQPALIKALSKAKGTANLDLASVEEFDSAGLQLLLAGARDATAKGAKLRILAASTAVREVLELCHRADLLTEVAA
jgi:anti-sigma B factor antagonist